jgi:threonine dehydratase
VAYAARALGVRATIVMPAIAPAVKVAKTRALGGQVVLLEGGGEEEWRVAAEELAAAHDYVMIPPFDDETIIAGQATVGLEIAEELPQVGLVLVPIGGGGLISGVAAALKLSGSSAMIVGVEPELANDAQLSFRCGRIETLPLEQTQQTIADGMRATRIGRITFAHIQAYVDDIITVSEAEIKEAMRRMVLETRLVPEPSGAVSLAAYLFHRPELPDRDLAVAVVSGGNVDPTLLADILRNEP